MKLISEVEDLAEWKRLCVHQKLLVDKIKYGQSDLEDWV
jgi:methyl coenzyme M reductase subunit D